MILSSVEADGTLHNHSPSQVLPPSQIRREKSGSYTFRVLASASVPRGQAAHLQPRPSYSCWVTSLIICRAMSPWSEGTWKQAVSALALLFPRLGLGSGPSSRDRAGGASSVTATREDSCTWVPLLKRASLLWNDPTLDKSSSGPPPAGLQGSREASI